MQFSHSFSDFSSAASSMSASAVSLKESPLFALAPAVPQCAAPIRWYDNIPLLSWVLLRGRCRDCHARIAWRYPAVELAVGLWFLYVAQSVLNATHLGVDVNGDGDVTPDRQPPYDLRCLAHAGIAILGFLLIGLIVMDWQTHSARRLHPHWHRRSASSSSARRPSFSARMKTRSSSLHQHIHLTSPGSVTRPGQRLPHRPREPHLRPHRGHLRSRASCCSSFAGSTRLSATAKAWALAT